VYSSEDEATADWILLKAPLDARPVGLLAELTNCRALAAEVLNNHASNIEDVDAQLARAVLRMLG
jgi:type II secretory pathway component PulM